VKIVRLKEYRIPLEEFKSKFNISDKIESISFWKTCKSDEGKEEPYVTVEVAEEQHGP